MEGMDEIDVRSVYAEDDGEVFIVAFETAAHSLAALPQGKEFPFKLTE